MEGICDECGVEFPADQGTVVRVEFITFGAEGDEGPDERDLIVCPDCAADFERND